MRKVLFLYTQPQPFLEKLLNKLISLSYSVDFVYWGECVRFSDYTKRNVNFIARDDLTLKQLIGLSNKPYQLCYISGWQDKVYLLCALKLRKKSCKVVCGFDDQLKSSTKQFILLIIGRFRLLKLFFDYCWVAGPFQTAYARVAGFRNSEIIFDLLSADECVFYPIDNYIRNDTSFTFLYVGRFLKLKGLDTLLEAWTKFSSLFPKARLVMIGEGSYEIPNLNNLDVYNFMGTEELSDFYRKSDCFILPSNFEQWGTVVHEAALSGLPIITSKEVGSSATFLINKYNGFYFNSRSAKSLFESMVNIYELDKESLKSYREASITLSKRISSESSFRNFISLSDGDCNV
jgi:glycosyltransferase involved in cell wall biosynthesis